MDQVYLQGSLNSSVSRVMGTLRELRRVDASMVRSPDGPLVHTRLQSIFSLRHPDPVDRMVHEVIMMHAVAAERLGPSGFDRCLEMLLEGFDMLTQGIQPGEIEKRLEVHLSERAAPPTASDVDWLLETYLGTAGPRTRGMLASAVELSGFNGNIVIERAVSQAPSVEAVRGYSFKLSPAIPVRAYLESPRIICVDGYIEDVAEVHHLLEAAAQAKEPVVLFVRGMGEDVRHTLRVNYDRGSLRVVPIEVQFDFEGINTLADLCAVTGADLVSSAKGDLISAIEYSEAPRIERASVFPDRVIIHESSTHAAVETQARKLRKRRDDAEHDVQTRLFDERLRTLTPNHVSIRLPDDREYVQNAQAIDYALRAYSSLLSHGTQEVNGTRILTATCVAGSVHAQRCLRTLSSAGAAVLVRGSGA